MLALLCALSQIAPLNSDWRQIALQYLPTTAPNEYRQFMSRLHPAERSEDRILLPLRAGKGIDFGSDRQDIVIDGQGRKWEVVPQKVSEDVAALRIELEDIALRRQDLAALRRYVQVMPTRASLMRLNEISHLSLRALYLEAGFLLADVQGLPIAANWLRLRNQKGQSGTDPIFVPLYAVRRGCRAPEVLGQIQANLSRRIMEPSSFVKPSTPSLAQNPVLWAEIAVAYRAYYPWQQEVHARRALALNPNQAHSAVVLMPILTRTGRAEESLKLAEQALKYATGRAKSLLEGGVRTAKTAIFEKTGRWPEKP